MRPRYGLAALSVALVGVVALAVAPAAMAGTITPTTTFDELDAVPDATCSLREAVQTANSDGNVGGCTDPSNSAGDADTIALAGGDFDLSLPGLENMNVGGDLDVTGTLTISGTGAASTGIDGNGALTLDRVLHVPSSALALAGLTIHDGAPASGGGGIAAGTGAGLDLTDTSVSGNHSDFSGGGILADSVTLTNSTVSGNDADSDGGGVRASTANLTSSTVSGNYADGAGGGIWATTPTLTDSLVEGNESLNGGGGGLFGTTTTLTGSTVSGNAVSGIMAAAVGGGIKGTTATLTGSKVSGNTAALAGGGVHATTASLTNSTVSDNKTSAEGGGINSGQVFLTNSTVSGNDAGGTGGGIDSSSFTSLTTSTVSGNEAGSHGGGIFNDSGSVSVARSTINGNDAGVNGGGILFSPPVAAPPNNETLDVTNSTLSGNEAAVHGGGISTDADTNLASATITGNTADSDANGGDGGGIFQGAPGAVTVKNTIVAANRDRSPATDGPDCFGTFTSQGYNLIGSTTGCTIDMTNNQTGDPLLTPLSSNGGPTQTHALLPGSPASPALDNGNSCVAIDQRGVARGGAAGPCDIGAVEGAVTPVVIAGAIAVETTFDVIATDAICSLREAITTANLDPVSTTNGCTDLGNSPSDTIVLAGGDYDLSIPGAAEEGNLTGDLDPTGTLTIQGDGAGKSGIDGNGALTLDRVLHAHAGANLTLVGVAVHSGASPTEGGGIYDESNSLVLTDSAVSRNTAATTGGGINGNSTLTRSTVNRNTAGTDGGGINASDTNLIDSSVTGNTATGAAGGGMKSLSSSITRSTVSGNAAATEGGGVWSHYTAQITDSTVSGNTAADGGGARAGHVNVIRSTVSGNAATAAGGGTTGGTTLTDSTVSGNTAGTTGGGINGSFGFTSGNAELTRSTVSGNTAASGGGIHVASNATLSDSSVSRNEATADYGGGIYTDSGSISVTRSTIDGNDAVLNGGGILFSPPVVAPPNNKILNITNSTVSGNQAAVHGGGISTDAETSFANATITANTSDSDNSGDGDGGGIFYQGSLALARLANTILAGNLDREAGAGDESHDCHGYMTSLGYNLIGINLAGAIATSECLNQIAAGDQTGNRTNPLDSRLAFLGLNGGPLTLTHALRATSPAIDAGYPGTGAGQPCPSTDQRGLPRGGANGLCDIGAFEVQTPAAAPSPSGAPAPSSSGPAKKKCKKGRKLKKGKCVKKKKKK